MTRVLTERKEFMFRRIEHLASRHMHHEYLERRHVDQSVSRFHFNVGYAILTSASVEIHEMEQVLTAVLLLKQGLSIHDNVDRGSPMQQPLFVLAGDYDSSKYYYILAQLNQTRLIHGLCDAVAKVNEAKMRVTLQPELSVQEYMRLMEVVQGQLLNALAVHYLGEGGIWLTQIQSLVQAHVVETEIMVRKEKSYITLGQASECLAGSLQRISKLPTSDLVVPLHTFVTEYFQPLQQIVQDLQLAEGNH